MIPEASLHVVGAPAAPTAQVISLVELHQDPAAADGAPKVLPSMNPLHAVRAQLQVCVGEIEMTLGELLAAREHQVVPLTRGIDEPIDLLLEGKVVARGQLVALNGQFGVRITELPLPLNT